MSGGEGKYEDRGWAMGTSDQDLPVHGVLRVLSTVVSLF